MNKVCSEWCLCTSLLAADDDAPRNYNSTQHHHCQQNLHQHQHQHHHYHQINIIISIIIVGIIIISSSIKAVLVASSKYINKIINSIDIYIFQDGFQLCCWHFHHFTENISSSTASYEQYQSAPSEWQQQQKCSRRIDSKNLASASLLTFATQ